MRVPDSPSLSNTVVEEDEVGDNEENSSCMPRQEDMLIGSGGSSRIEVERATTSPSGIAPASLLPAQISLVDNHEDGCVAVVVDVTQEAFFRRLTSTNSSVPRIIDVVALPSPPPATSNWNVCSSVEKVVEEEKYTPPELSSPRQIGDSCGMFDSALIGASTDNHHYRMSPGTKLHTAKKYTMMKQSMASISLPYSTASTGAAVDDDWEDQNASDESRNNIDPSRLTSRSIIFPTHFARSSRAQRETTAFHKQCKISAALDKCNTYCGKSSMKLCLEQMNLHAEDVPLEEMMGSSPHVSLYKALILANNPLGMIPLKLVHCLPSLKTLDLTNCRLKELPSSWDLPKLIELKLCRNQLCEFPENVSIYWHTAIVGCQ